MVLRGKKEVGRLILLFTMTYMVSYITRINYGAVISEIENNTGIARSLLSMAITGSFITYGAGQIVSGLLGDKVSPKRLVSVGLIVTVIMNILMPFCASPFLMLGVWCINGFAQSFMWPPIVRLMTALLSDADYRLATAKVSLGSVFGTIAIYLISPLLISVAGWRAVFVVSAVSGAIMLFIWNRLAYDIETEEKTIPTQKGDSALSAIFNPVMIYIMLTIILQGMLRDGVTTWMPTFISEIYDLSSVISILTGVILPFFSMLCIEATSAIYIKAFSNPVMCAGMVFGVGTLAALGMYFTIGKNVAFSVAFSAILTGCMHGVNLLLVCMIPAYFKKYGNVSTVSGIINSCTYIGSAISTYGIALISERLGWSATILIWIVIGALGTALSFVSVRGWKRKYQ